MNELFEKEKIASASEKIVKKIYEMAPPINEFGKVNYYIGGSLITNVLSKVKILNNYQTRLGEIPTKIDTIEMPEEAKNAFLNCARKSNSKDIDIINVESDPYPLSKSNVGIAPSKNNIRDGIEESFDLVFELGMINGDIMDRLETVEEMESFEFSQAILEDGSIIYMPSLLSILKFKAREVSMLEDEKKKEDFEKLLNAVKFVYDEEIINELLNEYGFTGIKK